MAGSPWKLRPFVLALLLVAPASSADLPKVFVLDPHVLQAHRRDGDLASSARAAADKALAHTPYSVIQKSKIPPSGDKHDYMSQAPYFWPDPSKPNGLPYLRKDGERNPEINQIPDHTNMDRMTADTYALALAWYFTGDEKYAGRAAFVLRAWFLDPATHMNPNLDFGQAIPGVNTGRGIGIIETRGLTTVVDSIGLLAGSKSWTAADQKGMDQWFGKFLQWLRVSKNGVEESKSENNHGTFYDLQFADFALFTGQNTLAKQILTAARAKRIAAQIDPDGRQSKETDRTRGISYSVMNLNGLMLLATVGDRAGVDFWHYQTTDGRSIHKALNWLIPYAMGDKKWEYQQIVTYDPSEFVPCLLRAAIHYKEPRYISLVLPSSPEDTTVRLLRLEAESRGR